MTKASDFSKEQAAAYVAAFVDGEGCVYFIKKILSNGHHHQARVITITNTDPSLIEAVKACFDILGIEYSTSDRPGQTENRKHRYVIDIRKGPAMWRFRALIPLQSPAKRASLDRALASYRGLHCKGCGCLHDEYTDGCLNCRKRHYFRERISRRKAA
jgi:hypothetical protein